MTRGIRKLRTRRSRTIARGRRSRRARGGAARRTWSQYWEKHPGALSSALKAAGVGVTALVAIGAAHGLRSYARAELPANAIPGLLPTPTLDNSVKNNPSIAENALSSEKKARILRINRMSQILRNDILNAARDLSNHTKRLEDFKERQKKDLVKTEVDIVETVSLRLAGLLNRIPKIEAALADVMSGK